MGLAKSKSREKSKPIETYQQIENDVKKPVK